MCNQVDCNYLARPVCPFPQDWAHPKPAPTAKRGACPLQRSPHIAASHIEAHSSPQPGAAAATAAPAPARARRASAVAPAARAAMSFEGSMRGGRHPGYPPPSGLSSLEGSVRGGMRPSYQSVRALFEEAEEGGTTRSEAASQLPAACPSPRQQPSQQPPLALLERLSSRALVAGLERLSYQVGGRNMHVVHVFAGTHGAAILPGQPATLHASGSCMPCDTSLPPHECCCTGRRPAGRPAAGQPRGLPGLQRGGQLSRRPALLERRRA